VHAGVINGEFEEYFREIQTFSIVMR